MKKMSIYGSLAVLMLMTGWYLYAPQQAWYLPGSYNPASAYGGYGGYQQPSYSYQNPYQNSYSGYSYPQQYSSGYTSYSSYSRGSNYNNPNITVYNNSGGWY